MESIVYTTAVKNIKYIFIIICQWKQLNKISCRIKTHCFLKITEYFLFR